MHFLENNMALLSKTLIVLPTIHIVMITEQNDEGGMGG